LVEQKGTTCIEFSRLIVQLALQERNLDPHTFFKTGGELQEEEEEDTEVDFQKEHSKKEINNEKNSFWKIDWVTVGSLVKELPLEAKYSHHIDNHRVTGYHTINIT
jgi:hypothetical protein